MKIVSDYYIHLFWMGILIVQCIFSLKNAHIFMKNL